MSGKLYKLISTFYHSPDGYENLRAILFDERYSRFFGPFTTQIATPLTPLDSPIKQGPPVSFARERIVQFLKQLTDLNDFTPDVEHNLGLMIRGFATHTVPLAVNGQERWLVHAVLVLATLKWMSVTSVKSVNLDVPVDDLNSEGEGPLSEGEGEGESDADASSDPGIALDTDNEADGRAAGWGGAMSPSRNPITRIHANKFLESDNSDDSEDALSHVSTGEWSDDDRGHDYARSTAPLNSSQLTLNSRGKTASDRLNSPASDVVIPLEVTVDFLQDLYAYFRRNGLHVFAIQEAALVSQFQDAFSELQGSVEKDGGYCGPSEHLDAFSRVKSAISELEMIRSSRQTSAEVPDLDFYNRLLQVFSEELKSSLSEFMETQVKFSAAFCRVGESLQSFETFLKSQIGVFPAYLKGHERLKQVRFADLVMALMGVDIPADGIVFIREANKDCQFSLKVQGINGKEKLVGLRSRDKQVIDQRLHTGQTQLLLIVSALLQMNDLSLGNMVLSTTGETPIPVKYQSTPYLIAYWQAQDPHPGSFEDPILAADTRLGCLCPIPIDLKSINPSQNSGFISGSSPYSGTPIVTVPMNCALLGASAAQAPLSPEFIQAILFRLEELKNILTQLSDSLSLPKTKAMLKKADALIAIFKDPPVGLTANQVVFKLYPVLGVLVPAFLKAWELEAENPRSTFDIFPSLNQNLAEILKALLFRTPLSSDFAENIRHVEDVLRRLVDVSFSGALKEVAMRQIDGIVSTVFLGAHAIKRAYPNLDETPTCERVFDSQWVTKLSWMLHELFFPNECSRIVA